MRLWPKWKRKAKKEWMEEKRKVCDIHDDYFHWTVTKKFYIDKYGFK